MDQGKGGLLLRFKGLLRKVFRGRIKERALKKVEPGIKPYVNRVISDAILLNEIPSPTYKEELRVNFITRRLNDFGISNMIIDDAGNVAVLFPASKPTDEYVLLIADIGNEQYSPLYSLVTLTRGRAIGNGVADNSIGVAALLVLAEYVQKNNLQYDRNLLFLFTNFTDMDSNLAPLHGFIEGWRGKISSALYIVGLHLGQIESKPMGNCKLTVKVKTEERSPYEGTNTNSAISILSNIAFQLGSIKWDDENRTILNVARILAGVGYGFYPSEGVMELEIYSGDMNALEMSKRAVCATINKIAHDTGASVEVNINSFIPVGNAELNAFLVEKLVSVHNELRIKSKFISMPDKTAILNSFGIPAISIGITTGKKTFNEEYIDLIPIEIGFNQLVKMLGKIAMEEFIG
ncbi:MAG: M28 family peptidase [Spirochaetota bacterium]